MLRDRTALLLLGGGAGGVMLEIKGRRVRKTKAKYEGWGEVSLISYITIYRNIISKTNPLWTVTSETMATSCDTTLHLVITIYYLTQFN